MLVSTGGVSKLGANLLVWISYDKRAPRSDWCLCANPSRPWRCLCLRHSEQQGRLQDRLAGALVLPKMSTGSALSFNNPS